MWLYWRRPLLIVLMTTCGVSLLTQGYLSLHILGSAAVYWSLLPLSGFIGLVAAERHWPKAAYVDSFFRGYWPWMIWLIGASAFALPLGATSYWFWEIAAAIAFIASSWLDYRFFGNGRKFVVSRIVSLVLWLGIFVASWPWSELAWRLGI